METGIPYLDHLVIPWLTRILLALLIFVIGRWIAKRLSQGILKVLMKSQPDGTLARFLGHIFYGFLLVAVSLAAVRELGVDISSLLALIGAAGLAVGLALKDSLANFAAGVMIVIFRPYKSGDSITFNSQSGTVDEIGMFSTALVTPDNQRIIIPNSTLISGTVVNSTAEATRRIDLILHLGPDDHLPTAKRVIADVLAADSRILTKPAPAIGVDKLGVSTIELFVRPWVATVDYSGVKADLQERLKLALDAVGIMIPTRPPSVIVQTAAKN
ncbi:MAG TPA: mechanosensitive ion channel domain-containing protein [Candidatus Acidoferrum sp.]|nr:mechanosensitive ion channel domain-containing protein [Candidatus Acidoferrum sp.]